MAGHQRVRAVSNTTQSASKAAEQLRGCLSLDQAASQQDVPAQHEKPEYSSRPLSAAAKHPCSSHRLHRRRQEPSVVIEELPVEKEDEICTKPSRPPAAAAHQQVLSAAASMAAASKAGPTPNQTNVHASSAVPLSAIPTTGSRPKPTLSGSSSPPTAAPASAASRLGSSEQLPPSAVSPRLRQLAPLPASAHQHAESINGGRHASVSYAETCKPEDPFDARSTQPQTSAGIPEPEEALVASTSAQAPTALHRPSGIFPAADLAPSQSAMHPPDVQCAQHVPALAPPGSLSQTSLTTPLAGYSANAQQDALHASRIAAVAAPAAVAVPRALSQEPQSKETAEGVAGNLQASAEEKLPASGSLMTPVLATPRSGETLPAFMQKLLLSRFVGCVHTTFACRIIQHVSSKETVMRVGELSWHCIACSCWWDAIP